MWHSTDNTRYTTAVEKKSSFARRPNVLNAHRLPSPQDCCANACHKGACVSVRDKGALHGNGRTHAVFFFSLLFSFFLSFLFFIVVCVPLFFSLFFFFLRGWNKGDNCYLCEKCGQRVTAQRRCAVKQLPSTLIVHLKRFEFDLSTMRRLKLNHRCSFPMELDMSPWTLEVSALRV